MPRRRTTDAGEAPHHQPRVEEDNNNEAASASASAWAHRTDDEDEDRPHEEKEREDTGANDGAPEEEEEEEEEEKAPDLHGPRSRRHSHPRRPAHEGSGGAEVSSGVVTEFKTRGGTGGIKNHNPGASSSSSSSSSSAAAAATATSASSDPTSVAVTTNANANSNSNSNWAVREGVRRVRSDAVDRKMNWLTLVAAIGGFLFGYDTGVISGAMLPLQRRFHLTPTMQERVVSSTVLAALVTSLAAGQFGSLVAGWRPAAGMGHGATGTGTGSVGGRRFNLRVAALIFAAGSLVLLMAWDYVSLVVGRVVVGIAIGLCSVNSPLYIAELSTPNVRGRLVTVNALLVTIGQFVAGVVDGILDGWFPNQGWRLMLGLAAVPALAMYLGLSALPESPRYLALQGRIDDARRVLMAYRESDDVAHHELAEILESVREENGGVAPSSPRRHRDDHEDLVGSSGSLPSTVAAADRHNPSGLELAASAPSNGEGEGDEEDGAPPPTPCAAEYGSTASTAATTTTAESEEPLAHELTLRPHSNRRCNNTFLDPIRSMLSDPPTRHALAVGCGLMAIQQCSGINTVMYYAASIYEMAGFGELTSVWLSAFTTLAQVVGIALSIVLVERVGRRTLVLFSLGAVALSLIGLGGTFYLARVESMPVTKALGHCQRQDAFVWSGVTSYCYDCATIPGCGYCASMCLPGTASGPSDLDLCPAPDLANVDIRSSSSASRNAPMSQWIYTSCRNSYGILSVLFMVSYLLAFGIGMGGMPWTINSEIYPLRHRSLAISCSTATNWAGNWVVSSTFLTLSRPSGLTAAGAFWLYSVVAAAGWAWLHVCLPETKGLSLEEIERLFRRGAAAALSASGYDRILDDDDDDEDDDDDDDGEEEDDDDDGEDAGCDAGGSGEPAKRTVVASAGKDSEEDGVV